VAVVDDIISTGASTLAALRLLRRTGAEPVVIGTLMTEGLGWRTALGADADLVRALGSMPLFRPADDGSGELVEVWE
jgi:adenine phosphoribosyltransferase